VTEKTVARPHGITHVARVKTVTATSAREQLYHLIDATLRDREPIQITGKRGNAVLVAEEDWRAIEERHGRVNPQGHEGTVGEVPLRNRPVSYQVVFTRQANSDYRLHEGSSE
jgi:hypothetical protein